MGTWAGGGRGYLGFNSRQKHVFLPPSSGYKSGIGNQEKTTIVRF
jgi:hypothetical protein